MADEALRKEVDAYVDEVWPDVLADMNALISINSVADPKKAEDGAPYGPEAHKALTCALGIAEKLGLEPHDFKGYIGYGELKGASDKQVATIAHVDVVPVGTGWNFEPLQLTQKDGYLLGRGVLDDKGPAILSLYAAHYFVRRVKQTGAPLPYTLRAMLGSDEELGMSDIKHYLAENEAPAFAFTPDANFPVGCGEKGHFGCTFSSPKFKDGTVVKFEGGTVSNAIPGLASVKIRANAADLPAAEGIDVKPAGEGLATLTAHGKGGHASLPAGTKNAIGMLVEYLREHDLLTDQEKPFFELLHAIHGSTDGSTLGIAATDDVFDPLTCIGGTISTRCGVISQTIDSRYPKSITGEEITERVTSLAKEFGGKVKDAKFTVPFLTDPKSAPVQALADVYTEVTGRPGTPFTMGGGTYARNFPKAVSFGPEDAAVANPDWVGIMHGPDEGVNEELMKTSLKIYILALDRLMGLEL